MITATPISPTQSNPYAAVAAGTTPGGGGIPSLNLPTISAPSINPASLSTNPSQVYSLLASAAPASLTATLGPLLNQVFGTQANLMAPIYAQQGEQGAARAQSDAMKRGLTGSSIEGANIGAAYASANQGYDQYLANQLSSLIPTYASLAGQDVSNTSNYYSTLAQAVGQQLASQISQQEFQKQLQAGLSQAGMLANAQQNAGIFQGLGSLVGGMAAGGLFSDVRLKKDLFPFAKWRGLTLYLFNYDRKKLPELPVGGRVGFLAHEVAKMRPDCVDVDRGYLKVDYLKLFGLPKRRMAIA